MVSVVLLQKDLRIADNPALFHAAQQSCPIVVVYVAPQKQGRASLVWAQESLHALSQDLSYWHIPVMDYTGSVKELMGILSEKISVTGVYVNDLDQPLVDLPCPVYSFYPNRLYFSYDKPYKICSPFWRSCQKTPPPLDPLPFPLFAPYHALVSPFEHGLSFAFVKNQPWVKRIGSFWTMGEHASQKRWKQFLSEWLSSYGENRDVPSVEGTSLLSPHLHFGEISIRQIWYDVTRQPQSVGKEKFINELAWREFSYQLRFFYPEMSCHPLQEKYKAFPWRNAQEAEKKWQQGMTGYPLVDAGMRQLWATGWMHNRVRMMTASFLVKNLLTSWQQGESWFFDTLVDADEAINATNWQWVAGCGTDSVPYFRIFNPTLQSQKYDPDGAYIKKWIPELAHVPSPYIHEPWRYSGTTYPAPIVDFKSSRTRALSLFDQMSNAQAEKLAQQDDTRSTLF